MARAVTAPIRSGRRRLCIVEIISPVEEKRAQRAEGGERWMEERRQFGRQGDGLRRVRSAGPGGPVQARAPAARFQERSQFRGRWVLIQRVVVVGRWGVRPCPAVYTQPREAEEERL